MVEKVEKITINKPQIKWIEDKGKKILIFVLIQSYRE